MGTDDAPGKGKEDFSGVYNRVDPREYFRAIRPMDYQIPQNAYPLFRTLLDTRRATGWTDHDSVLDLCCSYGVNAALLRCEVSLAEIFDHYEDSSLGDLTPEEFAEADRRFYDERRRADGPRMLGLDSADRAIDYARRVDLLDAGWSEDLENQDPSPALVKELRHVGLVTVTGGVGYITERTFGRLAGAFPDDRLPWVASFVLRMYPYDQISETLAEHGLVTEQLPDVTLRQRRFASAEEQRDAVQGVRARGLETEGKEDDGWYHCDFYLSRPRRDADDQPLADLRLGN